MVVDEALCVCELATWVPVKAKKRKRKVPANSPAMATKWFRTGSGLDVGVSALARHGIEGIFNSQEAKEGEPAVL